MESQPKLNGGGRVQTPDMFYKGSFESSRNMRIFATGDGRLMDVNGAAVAMLGYDNKNELLGKTPLQGILRHAEDLKNLVAVLKQQGFARNYPLELVRKDGTWMQASCNGSLWTEEDGSVFWEGTFYEVTANHSSDQALLESHQPSREFNDNLLHLLMIMSHDIRSPLIAMAATLKLLIRGSFGQMDVSVANVVRDLLSRATRALGIAEDFLAKASSVQGCLSIEREMFDLRQDIIDPVLDEMSEDLQKSEILIDNRLGAIPAGTIPIRANKIWLKTVFRNLFKNAIKYGGRGCRIAFGFEDRGSYYRLNVYNSGTPVPEEYRGRLFTKFGRIADGARSSGEGVGLGLYLIKEVIQRHGGDIWYEAKSSGSDFVFTLAKEEDPCLR